MKQKRKVKSLIPQKQKGQTYLLTTILLILSLVLCIGTAALITSFVGASDDDESEVVYKEFEYTGIDDNKETVYGIKFVDPSKMNKIVSDISIKTDNGSQSLYISSNSVVVNPIKSDGKSIDRNVNLLSGVYPHIKNSHILGGKNNKMYGVSDSSPENIVLIGGEGNIISSSNKNTVILGGSGNYVDQQYDTNRDPSAVLIGGQNNSVASAHHGPILIGGKNNYVEEHSTQTAILGGENNRVEAHGGGRIIGGKNVIVTGASDIFTYSNSDETFTPKSSKAFYLNMKKGVGVNTTGNDKGLFIDEAVKIDMDNWDNRSKPCNENNYGVLVSYSGCVVGCTKAGAEQGKWELLDEGADCKSLFKTAPYSSYVITNPDSDQQNQIKTTTYDAQCTNNIDTGHSTICSNDSNYTGGYLEFYKNVIFETTLLDSDSPCPVGKENQCIFRCDPDYHLTGNAADGTLKCHKDCVVPWDETKKMTHNQTIVGYNITGVSCSNDIYVFPFATEIINKGKPLANPLYTRWNTTINGVTYKNRAKNGRSPETCGNYDHQKTLICNEGEWYLVGTDGKADLSTSGAAANYKYGSCNIGNYACASSVLETNPCITSEDMYNCITNGGCDRNIYDLNHDKELNTADVNAINNAALQNKCYTQESATIIIDECVKKEDIYNCISNGGCDRKIYDVDGNGSINTNDVTAVNNAALQHKCYMKKYEYTQESISSQLQDSLMTYGDQKPDRSTFQGERGRYKVCYSYTAAGESCNVSEYRYDFLGCKPGYDSIDGICKQKCSLSGVPYKHGETAIGYKSSSETCTNTCQSATLLCNDGTWIHKSTLETNSCITTDDVYNCITNGGCDTNVYDVNGDENLDTADIVEINNVAEERKCYMRRSSLIDNPCVTEKDMYNCIINGGCNKDIYDLNGDGKINTTDVTKVNSAAGTYKCYMKSRTTNTAEANPCTTEKDIYNCITNGNCGMAYDVNGDGKLNTADVVAVNQKAENGQCFKKERNIETNPCITDDDIDSCIQNGGCNNNIYDVNGDGKINTADKVAIYNAASKHKCYYAGTNSETNINVEEYLNGNCTLRPKTCDSSYNVTYDEYLSGKDYGTYLACESYVANGQFVCTFTDIKYKLTACNTGYHTENGKICKSNVQTGNCTGWEGSHAYRYRSIESNIENYPRFVELGSQPISLPVGQYITRWTGTWNNGYWTGTYPEVACEWGCEGGRHKNTAGTGCDLNQCSGGDVPGNDTKGMLKGNTHPSGNSNKERSYYKDAYKTGYVETCQWGCKDGYYKSGSTCVSYDCHYCANNGFPYCFPIDFSDECRDNDIYYSIN